VKDEVSVTSTSTQSAEATSAPAPRRYVHGLDSLMIERATPAHVPYLRRLKVAVMTDRYRPAADEAGFADWQQLYCTDEYFEQLMDEPGTMMLCIGSLREPVGMVVLRRLGTQLEIDDLLCLHPRQGDGTRLLLASLRYAEAWRMDEVMIDVYPGHAQEAFLESHGFVFSCETSNDLGREMHRYVRAVPSPTGMVG
jgi:hypothetical protein